MKKNHFRRALLLALSLCFGQLFAQEQSNPSNSEIRKKDAAKEQFIEQHPEEYQQQGGQIKTTVPEFKTQAEKDAWVSQQAQKTQAEKDAWVSQQAQTVMTDVKTENREATIATEAEKDAYMQKHSLDPVAQAAPVTSAMIYMTQEEFNTLPPAKQAAVLADPNFVIVK